MQKQISSIVASLGAGILLALMMQLNASLGEAVGPLESSFVVHVIGTAFAFLLIFKKIRILSTFLIRSYGLICMKTHHLGLS